MKPVWSLAFVLPLLVIASQPSLAATPGVFRGTVVPPPAEERTANDAGWLYVEGHNHLIRRVALGHARIVYGEEIPEKQRSGEPELIEGTEVRVTAEQDQQGEWHALRIEVVGLATAARASRKTAQEWKISETGGAFYASNKGVE